MRSGGGPYRVVCFQDRLEFPCAWETERLDGALAQTSADFHCLANAELDRKRGVLQLRLHSDVGTCSGDRSEREGDAASCAIHFVLQSGSDVESVQRHAWPLISRALWRERGYGKLGPSLVFSHA